MIISLWYNGDQPCDLLPFCPFLSLLQRLEDKLGHVRETEAQTVRQKQIDRLNNVHRKESESNTSKNRINDKLI